MKTLKFEILNHGYETLICEPTQIQVCKSKTRGLCLIELEIVVRNSDSSCARNHFLLSQTQREESHLGKKKEKRRNGKHNNLT